ncbi:MAG TPA: type II/IV secretion system ATPase subunit [Candidatus Thermoplasmatota archaeon]|nr:type II/IV secretion system ATPase subunit [Candidatus Thermoplasmatota archaeon]
MLVPQVDDAEVDVVYPTAPGMYAHVHTVDRRQLYTVVEPALEGPEVRLALAAKDAIFQAALYDKPPKGQAELEAAILRLFDKVVAPTKSPGKVQVDPARAPILRYHVLRDIARYGPLEPFMQDPYLEDIQSVGTGYIHVIHKFFDMLPSNVRFEDEGYLDSYLRNLSERIGRPVSDARPIVDATLFDGSRINVVYSDDVSRKGPSFSIRRVHENPLSVTQLIAWKTLTAQIAAYLWLCLENSMSLFVCGEAACGKSTTLNSILQFIPPRSKLYSAEDTPEVRPAHPVWQRLLTRESGPEEARVKMFDLLKAALRSRPNYIVVGEIRGAEGAVAFQAMQTGHPTVASFHASNKVKMIQRLTADPINIPLTFMDNLNVAVFQQALYKKGRLIRRVTAVDEIEGYSEMDGGIMTRPVFVYDAASDRHTFKGMNNSYILEKKIAEQHGYEDPRQIYAELELRTRVLQGMVDHGILETHEVNRLLFAYADKGPACLPFKVDMPEGLPH